MSKFKFEMSSVVEARSLEEALSAVATHIATCSRQTASGVEGVAPEFAIAQVDDKTEAVDLTDQVTAKNGPIELELDPKSAAGVAMAAQKVREESDRAARARVKENEGKTDAEVLAEHSAREQAALNTPAS